MCKEIFGKETFAVEERKGIKLSRYVRVNNEDTNSVKELISEKKLIKILYDMYSNADEGHVMSMIHLFGIKYADSLKCYSVNKIANEALNKGVLVVEINKGIRLSKYVEVIQR